MELHVEALYTHDDAGNILRVREHEGARAPRFFVGRTPEGIVRRFRDDVSEDLRRELELASRDRATDVATQLTRYASILERAAPVQSTEAGPAYSFPDIMPSRAGDGEVILVTDDNLSVLQPLLAPWIPDVHRSPPLMALVIDGQAVAVCGSVRITPRAHEAGVETVAAHRGRGYAARVVAAWARAVRALGAVPLYSTAWKNAASQALARKLGLIQFGEDIHLS